MPENPATTSSEEAQNPTESAPATAAPANPPTGSSSTPHSPFPVHPLFFALFPLLSLYAANVGQVPWTDVVRPVGVALAGMALLLLFWGLLLRNLRRAALIVSVTLFLFFSYGHFLTLQPIGVDLLGFFSSDASAINPGAYLVPLWILLLAAAIVVALRSKRNFGPITAILNVVGFVLVAMPGVQIATSGSRYPGFAPVLRTFQLPTGEDEEDGNEGELPKLPPGKKTTPLTPQTPSIYYIILDAYGRADVLKKFYGYDNSPFLDALRKRGFYIADRAHPNYCQTIASISSSLNLTYLDKIVQQVGVKGDNLFPLHEMVDHNAAAAYLHGQGYQFISISTGFGLTTTPDADMALGGKSAGTNRHISPYEGFLLDLTPLSLFPRTNETLYDQHRDSLRDGFHYLTQLPRLHYRKFVFAHILAPHPPFVFDEDGKPIDPQERPFSLADGSDWMKRGNRAEYRTHYIQQLRFTNDQVIKTIDVLLKTSLVRPIIIVQGDHGPRQFLDWKSLKDTDVRETYGNLNAYELPDGTASKVFYADITPVNSFRLLFDHVFGANYARLPDRSFYSTLDHPYDYTDVTSAALPGAPNTMQDKSKGAVP